MNRIEELENIIKHHNHLYWDLGTQEISDEEYDKLVNELKSIDQNNVLINQVNAPKINSNGKIHHDVPMLSLDKIYDLNELKDWVEKKSRNGKEVFLIQPKYDGISGKLENNILSTRGNGEIGENITDKLSIINIESNKKDSHKMLGEILIKTNDFENIFSKIVSPSTKKCYKNPRNATAGIMGTDDITFFKKQGAKLTLVDYDLISYVVTAENFSKEWENIEKEITALPYPMDGIVIKIKDEEYGKSLGNTAHHPKNAVAFKFTNPKKETKLIDVEWSQGKNYLTPVAIFEPIELDGITISRASLANYDNLRSINAFIGDYVTIERAGRVIPHIIQVRKNTALNERKSPFITICPCCGSNLIISQPEILCPNENCFDKQTRRLLFSVRAIGIENVGLPTIEKIMKDIHVQNLYDFMQLSESSLIKCGFGEKTSENIISEINKAKTIKDYQYLTCLNISDMGGEIAKLILNEIPIEEIIAEKNVNRFTTIHGIGEITANKIIDYFSNNYDYAVALLSIFNIIKTEKIDKNAKTVCFTGAMEQPRKYYEEIAKKKGIIPLSSVNSSLTYLVVADKNSTSSKMKKAQKYGTIILTVDEFLNL